MRRSSCAGLAAAALAALSAAPALACSACGCSLTSDWVGEGLTGQPGWRAELRYDYLPQTDLRSGTHGVDRSAITLPADREIERYTRNHYVTASLDYMPSQAWGVSVQLPYILRPHDTVAEGDTDLSHSRTDGIGDLRVIGRYQGFGGSGITGVQFGLKLPTGGFHTRFSSGPVAGEFVDRGLQAGTGTTDLIAGAYHFGALAGRFDWFTSAQVQVPLNRRADFRPGVTAVASAGVDYTGWRGITPQLQVNLRRAWKDRGFNSDGDNSGGTLAYVSPGASVRLTTRIVAFAHLQLPLYQKVYGFQLTPKVTVSTGIQMRL